MVHERHSLSAPESSLRQELAFPIAAIPTVRMEVGWFALLDLDGYSIFPNLQNGRYFLLVTIFTEFIDSHAVWY